MINFYEFKDDLKRGIFKRLDKIDPIKHPTDWAWITYAFSQDGKENNRLFKSGLDELEKWAQAKDAGKQERHLAPLSICVYFGEDKEKYTEIKNKVISILDEVLKKEISKFSPLNDPEQVFCISIISKHLPNKHKRSLLEIISKRLEGRVLRQVLYVASLIELGNKKIEWSQFKENDSPEDLIALIWFYERYKKFHTKDVISLWKSFENIKSMINLNTLTEGEGLINISNRSISMLYEAVSLEIRGYDPNMLFDIYPLHRRVREISEKHFKKGSLVIAVDQATKVLNEFIQEKTGIKNKNEAELVQSTMKNIQNLDRLKIKFNKFLDEDSGKNEQSGLALISEGVFKAFRNPKGHKPEDHPIVHLDAYEALDQLITISYLMQRIEKAES
jgi:uncharacterized protein (TIGR02391 family)